MPFELRIALRYLTARRKQAFISVISAISVLGVVVGVMALMVALGLMTGLQREIRARSSGATAHISIFRSGNEPFDDYREVVTRRAGARVLGAAPAVYGKGLMTTAGRLRGGHLKGVVPAEERTVTDSRRRWRRARSTPWISGEAACLPCCSAATSPARSGVGVGDVVSVTSPHGRLSPYGMLPRIKKFRVAGTVHSGLYEFDAHGRTSRSPSAQRLFTEAGQRVARGGARRRHLRACATWRRASWPRWARATHHGLDQMNQSLFSALWLEKIAIGITIGLIVMVAALNIVATLILLVMEKHKDIAILVSMGASRGRHHAHLHAAGHGDRRVGTLTGACWAGAVPRARPLQAHPRARGRLPDLLRAVHAAPARRAPSSSGRCSSASWPRSIRARGASRLDPAEALRYE
jgi:lipoprotein-releasing system permease protein